MKQTLIVKAIIKHDQKILLLRRAGGNPLYSGLYELPGGKVDFGEDPREALRREVTEEVGCILETQQLFDVYSELDTRDAQHQYIVLVFVATLTPNLAITLSTEHDKYAWKQLSKLQLNTLTTTTMRALQIKHKLITSD